MIIMIDVVESGNRWQLATKKSFLMVRNALLCFLRARILQNSVQLLIIET